MDNKHKVNDEALEKALSSKDEGKVVELCENIIWFFINKYGYNRIFKSSVDDLVQEGRIAILNCARTYDASRGSTFITYVFSSIRNALNAYVKRNKYFDTMNNNVELVDNFDESAHSESAYNEFSQVEDEINTIPIKHPKAKEILRLKFIDGYKTSEICEMLGVKRNVVSSCTNSFIARMKRKYFNLQTNEYKILYDDYNYNVAQEKLKDKERKFWYDYNKKHKKSSL